MSSNIDSVTDAELLDKEQEQISAPSSSSKRFHVPFILVFAGLGIVALTLNLYRLGDPSMWFDAILSVERARQPLPTLINIITTTQPNMALYYVVLHFWLRITEFFGILPVEFVVRFPSAIFAVLSALVLLLFGKRFVGYLGGTITAALYILSALQLTYAQEVRSYSLQLLLLGLSWYALCSACTTPRRSWGWWVCYVLTISAAIYAHLFSLLILAAQFAAFALLLLIPTTWRQRLRQRFVGLLISLCCVGVLILPLLLWSQGAGKTGWLPKPQPNDIYNYWLAITAGNRIYAAMLIAIIVLGLVLLVFGLVRRFFVHSEQSNTAANASGSRNAPGQWEHLYPVALVILCWSLIPFVLSYIISQGSTRLFSTRYLVSLLPAFLLLAGLAIELLRWRVVRILVSVAFIIIACRVVPHYYRGAQVEDWRYAAFWVQDQYHQNDGMVCYDNDQGCQLGIEYYFRAYPRDVTFPQDSPGSFPWVQYDLTNEIPVATRDAVDLEKLQAYGDRHERLFFIVGRLSNDEEVARVENALSWMDGNYQRLDMFETRTVQVYLYEIPPASSSR